MSQTEAMALLWSELLPLTHLPSCSCDKKKIAISPLHGGGCQFSNVNSFATFSARILSSWWLLSVCSRDSQARLLLIIKNFERARSQSRLGSVCVSMSLVACSSRWKLFLVSHTWFVHCLSYAMFWAGLSWPCLALPGLTWLIAFDQYLCG